MRIDITPDQVEGMAYDWDQIQLQLSEWINENVHFLSDWTWVIPPALGLVAVCLGSRHSLKTYIAQSQAPAPAKVLPATVNVDGIPINRGILALRTLALVTAFCLLEAMVLFVLPAHQKGADAFWIVAVMMGSGIPSMTMARSIMCSSSVRLTRTIKGQFVLSRIPPDGITNSRRSLFLSIAFPFATIALLALWLLTILDSTNTLASPMYGCLVGAAITSTLVASFHGPKIRMKYLIAFLGLYPILLLGPSMVSISVKQGNVDIWQMISELRNPPPGIDPEIVDGAHVEQSQGTSVQATLGVSDQVAGLLMTAVRAVVIGIPGILAAVALRFDYSMHLAKNALLPTPRLAIASGPVHAPRRSRPCAAYTSLLVQEVEGVILPARLPAFDKPMYRSVVFIWISLWTLLYGVLGLPDWIGICVFTLPVLAVVMILKAARMGVSKEFWGYTESWCLKPQSNAEDTLAVTSNATDLEKAQLAVIAQRADLQRSRRERREARREEREARRERREARLVEKAV